MTLSRSALKNIAPENVRVPANDLFVLPEKLLQFGTGVLLRGLCNYFIDKANRQALFNGRAVVVKSTAHGSTDAFARQDGLYTLCVRGVEEGANVEENWINASISRVLSAATQWDEILQCARNPQMQVIVSNTTEVGIQLAADNIFQKPPHSFPGKLLAFLYHRFKAFGGSPESGMVIIPTELVPDNGQKLQGIVLELAAQNSLEPAFAEWLQAHNRFCASLVDRIVPGTPEPAARAALEQQLGYHDDLLIEAEAYRLWAIEGDERVAQVLSFAAADKGVIIAPDITSYRELKLRLLNGTHTLSCGLGFLGGFETVKEAMANGPFEAFAAGLMLGEIAPAIPYRVNAAQARTFGLQVLDRFRNPFLQHRWLSITLQYTSKVRLRCIPVLLEHYRKNDTPPERFALGFAAYLAFTRPVAEREGKYWGQWAGREYPVLDDHAAYFYRCWQHQAPQAVVAQVLSDAGLWGTSLTTLPLFAETVQRYFDEILRGGVQAALELVLNKKAVL